MLRSITRNLAVIGCTLSALLGVSFALKPSLVQARPQADLIVNPGDSIQAAIDAANDGDTIIVNAGDYTESLTLSKPVSLTGVNSDTTIIHAVAGQRVLTVTGATISNSVVISGLTFTGGDATNGQGTGVYPTPTPASGMILPTPTCTPTPAAQRPHAPQAKQANPLQHDLAVVSKALLPADWLKRQSPADFDPMRDGLGGGLLITDSAQPKIQAVRAISNLAGYGGGLYVYGTEPVLLTQSDVVSNVAVVGGGLYAQAPITLLQSNLSGNAALAVGGGAQVLGALIILDSHISHNEGDGLHVDGDLTVQRSEISFNTPGLFHDGGGIIHLNGVLSLDKVTVEGNHSDLSRLGGGVFTSHSMVWITNTRVVRNSAFLYSGLNLY